MRAYVIRVSSPDEPPSRFAVLAGDSGQAMAAVIASLGVSDIAEVTDEVLDMGAAVSLRLEPGRPLRLV